MKPVLGHCQHYNKTRSLRNHSIFQYLKNTKIKARNHNKNCTKLVWHRLKNVKNERLKLQTFRSKISDFRQWWNKTVPVKYIGYINNTDIQKYEKGNARRCKLATRGNTEILGMSTWSFSELESLRECHALKNSLLW